MKTVYVDLFDSWFASLRDVSGGEGCGPIKESMRQAWSAALVIADKDRDFRATPNYEKAIGGSDVCATCEAHVVVMIEDEDAPRFTKPEREALNCALDHMTNTKWMTPCTIPEHVEAIREMLTEVTS